MSNTRTDPSFDPNDIIDFTPEQIASDVSKLVENITGILKKINASKVILEQDFKSIQRCCAAMAHGALILSSAHEAKIALARAKYCGRG